LKKTILAVGALTVMAALAEAILLAQMKVDPWRLGALLESLALILGVFVALTYTSVVRQLRQWALESGYVAFGLPFLLLIPYFIYALGTGAFSLRGTGKLAAYLAAPTLLLLPDRWHRAEQVGWRDFAAMLALALPVSAHWLNGIWTWPQDLYFFRPVFCVCVGVYAFLAIRNLDGVGYRLLWRKGDVREGLINLVAFSLLAIPLGLALNFLHPHSYVSLSREFQFHFLGGDHSLIMPEGLSILKDFGANFCGIYLTVAIPEELLFRGILQNFLVRSIRHGPPGLYGLLIASVVFGAFHLHHRPVPNWRYAILATLAGIFYGNAYRTRQRLSASALTHALVDTAWHFWF
jgi:CAAX protease family protein